MHNARRVLPDFLLLPCLAANHAHNLSFALDMPLTCAACSRAQCANSGSAELCFAPLRSRCVPCFAWMPQVLVPARRLDQLFGQDAEDLYADDKRVLHVRTTAISAVEGAGEQEIAAAL